jgi:hypothetical protein
MRKAAREDISERTREESAALAGSPEKISLNADLT